MVFVNNVKFACQSCIKGHRSSGCHHTDRPLFEIKRKGRPVSQCEDCRELRRTKRAHVKCLCEGKKPEPDTEPVLIQSAGKHKSGGRKIPTVPTLPNGLKDVLSRAASGAPTHPKQKVDSLLNPDDCTYQCQASTGTLKRACCASKSGGGATVTITPIGITKPAGGAPFRSCCASKRKAVEGEGALCSTVQGDFQMDTVEPAILLTGEGIGEIASSLLGLQALTQPSSLPTQTDLVLPSVEEITMRCLCGARCLCPGCKQHRGEDAEGTDCPDGCPSCVDNESGPQLPRPIMLGRFIPEAGSSTSTSTTMVVKKKVHKPSNLGRLNIRVHPSLMPTTRPTKPSCCSSKPRQALETPTTPVASTSRSFMDSDDLDAEGSPDPDYIPLPPMDVDPPQEVLSPIPSTSTKRPCCAARQAAIPAL